MVCKIIKNGLLPKALFLNVAFLLPIVIGTFQTVKAQNLEIGKNASNPSAKLGVQSFNSGFLPPRMTIAQRAAIANPAAGLMVWCTDCGLGGGLSVFNGTKWRAGNFSTVFDATVFVICAYFLDLSD